MTLRSITPRAIKVENPGDTALDIPALRLAGPSLGGDTRPSRRTRSLLIKQSQTEWCWAACIQMLMSNRFGSYPAQCTMAGHAFLPLAPESGCSDPQRINFPLPVGRVAQELARWGMSSQSQSRPVSFQSLVSEISANRPVKIGLLWNGNGGHAVLVVGWDQSSQGRFLILHDPQRGAGSVWYEDLMTAYGLGNWSWTWTNIS